jgi:3-oxoacyl-[acyl-carrier protein] reductase
LDVNEDDLGRTADELVTLGAEVEAIVADVTDLAAVQAAVDRVVDRFGRLDAAHNNAGVAGPFLPLDEYPPDEFLRVLQTDLIGVWHCMRAEIAQMRRQGSGAIVNTSSMLGDAAMPDNSAYIAAKHGVNGLTRAAALELGGLGIRVNALAPGYIDTEMNHDFWATPAGEKLTKRIPQRRVGSESDLDGAILLLASNASRYMTGSVVTVDGGFLLT